MVMVTFIKNWNINSIIIAFWLVQNKRTMHDIELITIWAVLSIICFYPADNLRESIFWPAKLVISFCHHLEQQALKSLWQLNIKEILDWCCSQVNQILYRNPQTRHGSNLGNSKYRLKNIFHLANKFQSLSNHIKYKYHLF